jgi:uncharacterized protein YraI
VAAFTEKSAAFAGTRLAVCRDVVASMNFKSCRKAFGLMVASFALLTAGCGTEVESDEELTSADEESVATTADALSGSVAVGASLRTTTALNLRSGAGTNHRVLLTMPAGATVTARQSAPVGGWYAITYGSTSGWASGTYLAAASGGSAPAPGTKVRILGPAVRAHVQAFANAACASVGCPFELGTRVGHSPSADRAVDVMMARIGTRPTDGGARGTRLAAFSINNAARYKVLYTIWQQRINTLDGRGWRMMANRGSITQNHFDHVHVSFKP